MIENTTFVVPLRIESTDRLRNVIVSTCYLLENTDATVIIKEVDTASTFAVTALPQIRECVGDKNAEKLLSVFEKSDDKFFHRTRILNDMTMMSTTPVVVNYDCDILLPIPKELDLLEEAKKYLKQYSYRDVAAWLSEQSDRYISHVGLMKRVKSEQKRKREAANQRYLAEKYKAALEKAEKLEAERLGGKGIKSNSATI